MPAGKVDRNVLSSNYQQPGDIYQDGKTEGAFEVIAQQVDDNYDFTTGLISAGTLSKLGLINVKDYGAKGDGVADDTQAFIDAFAYGVANGYRKLFVPDGTYMIDGVGEVNPTDSNIRFAKVNIPSNFEMNLAKNAVLKAITNSSAAYAILGIKDAENITITGGTIRGDRDTHTGTTGEWGMGLFSFNGDNIKITDVRFEKCWGDGILFSETDNFIVDNIICDDNRRQGVSVSTCVNGTFEKSLFNNTNGTAPQSGIDLEPDPPYTAERANKNIVINNCRFTGNAAGAGVQVTYNTYNTKIINCYFENNLYGVYVVGHVDDLVSRIRFPKNTTIQGNHFVSTDDKDIITLYADDLFISNNTIKKDINAYCIEVNTGKNIIISGNRLVNNGIRASSVDRLTVVDNIIFDAPLGISAELITNSIINKNMITALSGIFVFNSSRSVKISENMIDGVSDVASSYFIKAQASTCIDIIENTLAGTFTTTVTTVAQVTCDLCRIIGNNDRKVLGASVNRTEAFSSTNYVRMDSSYVVF